MSLPAGIGGTDRDVSPSPKTTSCGRRPDGARRRRTRGRKHVDQRVERRVPRHVDLRARAQAHVRVGIGVCVEPGPTDQRDRPRSAAPARRRRPTTPTSSSSPMIAWYRRGHIFSAAGKFTQSYTPCDRPPLRRNASVGTSSCRIPRRRSSTACRLRRSRHRPRSSRGARRRRR